MKNKKKNINDIQDKIIKDFSKFQKNKEKIINYIIEIGNKNIPLEEKYKIKKNIIEGCMSKVWITYQIKKERIIFKADSNTIITKGLINLLILILSEQEIDEIIKCKLYFIEKIGISKIIGTQRSSGIQYMIKKIKILALINKYKKKN